MIAVGWLLFFWHAGVVRQSVLTQASETARNQSLVLREYADQALASILALIAGRFVPARFTSDAQFYFSPQAVADFHQSLSALGPCRNFTAKTKPRLRGGFEIGQADQALGQRFDTRSARHQLSAHWRSRL